MEVIRDLDSEYEEFVNKREKVKVTEVDDFTMHHVNPVTGRLGIKPKCPVCDSILTKVSTDTGVNTPFTGKVSCPNDITSIDPPMMDFVTHWGVIVDEAAMTACQVFKPTNTKRAMFIMRSCPEHSMGIRQMTRVVKAHGGVESHVETYSFSDTHNVQQRWSLVHGNLELAAKNNVAFELRKDIDKICGWGHKSTWREVLSQGETIKKALVEKPDMSDADKEKLVDELYTKRIQFMFKTNNKLSDLEKAKGEHDKAMQAGSKGLALATRATNSNFFKLQWNSKKGENRAVSYSAANFNILLTINTGKKSYLTGRYMQICCKLGCGAEYKLAKQISENRDRIYDIACSWNNVKQHTSIDLDQPRLKENVIPRCLVVANKLELAVPEEEACRILDEMSQANRVSKKRKVDDLYDVENAENIVPNYDDNEEDDEMLYAMEKPE